MAIDKAKLIQFLDKGMNAGKGGVYVNVLKLVATGQNGDRVELIEEWKRPFEGLSPAELASAVIEKCESDIAGTDNRYLTYKLLPFYGEMTTATGRFPIKVENHEFKDPEVSDEPIDNVANPKAFIAQLYQFNLNKEKVTTGVQLAMMTNLLKHNEELRQRIKELEASREAVVIMREEALNQSQERQMRAMKEAANMEMKQKFMSNVLPLVISIFGKFAGGTGIPGAEAPELTTLKAIVASMTREELEAVMAALGTKALPFMEMAIKWKGEVEEAEAKKNAIIGAMMPGMPNVPGLVAPPQMSVPRIEEKTGD